MPRTILVTEGDSPLGGALVRLFAARGCFVVATSERAPAADPAPQTAARSPLLLAWNRRSPVSARTVLLGALNATGSLDEAIILEPPWTGAGLPLHETASAAIERAFDDAKGPAFLAREVIQYFRGRGTGVLGFVCDGPGAGPVENAAQEAFRGMAATLLSGPGAQGIVINGFRCGETADIAEDAAFIDRTLEEKARKISGRWFARPPRGGLFQGVRAGPPRKA